ncbi:MAG: aminotransferase class V-fold PLP-dependent enzyme [Fusicatenibacter saccharivorans]
MLQYRNFTNRKSANPLRGFYPLSLEATESYQEARKTVQEFIHAEESRRRLFYPEYNGKPETLWHTAMA